MLRHLGEQEAANRIQQAVEQTIAEGIRTRDLGGTASTSEFTDAVKILAETLGDEEVDVETILRFVASLIHENNVRIAEALRD